MTDFQRRVRAIVAALRPGEVVSYGEVAAQAGYPGAARGVGAVLRGASNLPWWRVVAADGRLLVADADEQALRLRAEGVPVEADRVPRFVNPDRRSHGQD